MSNPNLIYKQDQVLNEFKTKSFSEIIKNKDCTFSQDDSEKQIYYFCRCSTKTYFPICKSCADSCHGEHNPKFSIEGYFECSCGIRNHSITQKNELKFRESLNTKAKCFYNPFYSKCFNKGYYKCSNGKNLCSICYFNSDCNTETAKPDPQSQFNEDYCGECECENHDDTNVVTLSNELNKNLNFKDYMLNFNFNIIQICPNLKSIFIDFMNDKLNKLIEKGEENPEKTIVRQDSAVYSSKKGDPNISFFTDFVVFTLFNIFAHFQEKYSSQFLHIKNIFSTKNPFDMVDILKNIKNFQYLLDTNVNLELYFKTKANYAFLMFHIFIKSHFLNFNNLLNLKSLLNLNIVQRVLYIHNSKSFYLFAQYSSDLYSKKNKGDNLDEDIDPTSLPLYDFRDGFSDGKKPAERWADFIDSFAKGLVDIMETMLAVHDNEPIIHNVISDVSASIAKIMKFLIKYNLIEDSLKIRYFEIIMEILVATVNQIDEDKEDYNNFLEEIEKELKEQNSLTKLRNHEERMEYLTKKNLTEKANELQDKFNEQKDLQENLWFLFPVLKPIFYFLLKKNDDLVIMKLRKKFNKITSEEVYSFVSNDDSNLLSKIFILCLKLFNDNFYLTVNKECVYKKKILKWDLYVKKILELMIGNNDFYLKSLESILHEFKYKMDSLFVQEMGNEKNNPDAYIKYFKSDVFLENNKQNHLLGKLNMNVLIKENDYHLEIIKSLNHSIYLEFNRINIDFGNLSEEFYNYDIGFKQFTEKANSVLERFKIFFHNLGQRQKNIKKNFRSVDDESIMENPYENNLEANENLGNKLAKSASQYRNDPSMKPLNDFKQILGFTDFMENFNEFLDIYSRSKYFHPELQAINIRYELLKFILDFLFIIADNNNENLVLIMTINPNRLVDSFFEHRAELCTLLERISEIVSKFDYNDNYFFLTGFIDALLRKLTVDENGMSIENFDVLIMILKSFKKLLPKYNLYNHELINTYEILCAKITEVKNSPKMMKEVESFVKNLYPENKYDNNYIDNNKVINVNKPGENNNKLNESENSKKNENVNQSENSDKLLLKENKIDYSVESINGSLKIDGENAGRKILNEGYAFQAFFKNYFALLNIAFDKDLYYYDLFYDKDIVILNKDELKKITKNSKNMRISFREEVERFIHNYNLKAKVKFSTVEREFAKYQMRSNVDRNPKHIFSGKFKDCLYFSTGILEDQLINFEYNCGLSKLKVSKRMSVDNMNIETVNKINQKKTKKEINELKKESNEVYLNNISKLNAIFSYLENAIISPFYKIINLFMLDFEKSNGDDYFEIYKLVYYFHHVLYNLYNLPIVKSLSNNEYLDKSNKYIHLSQYLYGDLKQNLSRENLNYLEKNINKLKEIKYYHIEEVINIFRITLAIIKKNNTFNFIHLRKKFYRFNLIENAYLRCYDEHGKDKVFMDFYNKIIDEGVDYFLKSDEKLLYEIIEEYKKTVSETFGNDFSIINALQSRDLDAEINLSETLFNYLINKFADKLTRANEHLFIPQNVFTFDEDYKIPEDKRGKNNSSFYNDRKKNYKNYVEGKYLKMQNFYALHFLGNLFFFDPPTFQEVFEHTFAKEKDDNEKEKNPKPKKNNDSLYNNSADGENENSTQQDESEEEIVIDRKKINYFLSIINKYFIFGNLMCESGKLLDIYNERTLIRSDFIYDLLIKNIFFMQNICEGHNLKMQEIMYDLRLAPNSDVLVNLKGLNKSELASQMSINSNNDNNNDKNAFVDGTRKKINEWLKDRDDFRYSYINFLSNMMRTIIGILYFDFDSKNLFLNKTFSLNSNFTCIYRKLTDLIIEMVQGTNEENLYNFYVPEENKEKEIPPVMENINRLKKFQFLVFLLDVKRIFQKDCEDPEKEFTTIKTLSFSILNNILNQENVLKDFIEVLIEIFNIEFLTERITNYMKKLNVRYYHKMLYEHPGFQDFAKKLNFKKYDYEDFYSLYLTDEELPKDDYFLVSVQIYYFINIIGDKFEMQAAIKILELEDDKNKQKNIEEGKSEEKDSNESNFEYNVQNNLDLKANKLEDRIKSFFDLSVIIKKKEKLSKKKSKNPTSYIENNNNQREEEQNLSELNNNNEEEENPEEPENIEEAPLYMSATDKFRSRNTAAIKPPQIEDLIYTKKFYAKIVQSVEFMIDNNVKEIYFIKNPSGYLINPKNIDKFFEEADRKDQASKIMFLLDKLEDFQIEIEFKQNTTSSIKNYLLKYDYKYTDFFSFLISMLINTILILTLNSENFDDPEKLSWIKTTVQSLGYTQIAINFTSLVVFYFVKKQQWISYQLNNIRKTRFTYMGNEIIDEDIILSKLTFLEKVHVYWIDCFINNKEINLIFINFILGIIGVLNFSATIVYSVQLITVARFVGTILDIVLAFKSRFNQLAAMVLFMWFLIYIYTNINFYFFNDEFNKRSVGYGLKPGYQDTCVNLITCFIYHFNEGTRAGGGIGDYLSIKSWEDIGTFMGRWIIDIIYFTSIILLLLNMINGIIVSTFSSLREESEKKKEDIDNRCYICSIDKSEFEKRKVSFDRHIRNEHNVKDYINFILYLKMTSNKDLDANQGQIKEQINDRDINVFPIFKSKALGEGNFEKEF